MLGEVVVPGQRADGELGTGCLWLAKFADKEEVDCGTCLVQFESRGLVGIHGVVGESQ